MLRQKTQQQQKTENTATTKQQFENMKAKTIDSTKLVTIKSPTQQTKQNAVPTLAARVKVNDQTQTQKQKISRKQYCYNGKKHSNKQKQKQKVVQQKVDKVINKTVTNSKTTTIFVKKRYISLQLQLEPAKRNSEQQTKVTADLQCTR